MMKRKKNSEQEEKEYETISEIFKLGFKQPIEINMQNFLATKKFWKKQHRENPDYVNSLKMAWERIEKYEEELKKIFIKEGVPEEFIYLSIPESYWNCAKNPGKKAKGVFQITKNTGRIYGMIINNKIDDRDDPIKSGRVAAKHLSDSHKITGDWNIDLAAYNGSMANDYLNKTSINQNAYKNFLEYAKNDNDNAEQNFFNYRVLEKDNAIWSIAYRFGASIQEIKQQNGIKTDNKIIPGQILKISVPDQEKIKKSKRSYEGFLAYMQDSARQEKKKILALKFFRHRVRRGDAVYNIARRFNISEAELKSENNIGDGNKISLGQILKIPIDEKTRKKLYDGIMGKYVENLNYPPKFAAVMELIEEGFVKRDQNFQLAKK
ncbi:LysM peptidoglycan-binding domain-containing protein [Candidatus Parcubacteria bacterium]|nr:LysM peptidoglycan-binding domain-containing protein [Candidatus Parcubacteria bacterium]